MKNSESTPVRYSAKAWAILAGISLSLTGCNTQQASVQKLFQDTSQTVSGRLLELQHRIDQAVEPVLETVETVNNTVKTVQSGAQMMQKGVETLKRGLGQ